MLVLLGLSNCGRGLRKRLQNLRQAALFILAKFWRMQPVIPIGYLTYIINFDRHNFARMHWVTLYF